ncbi:hypothetical protein WR25_12466 [Diploscapter pachys]|uniref:Uncharacterized protein n=1 Tax=Diploscapter pachys TaxID=2018661 RepID=A0A2A2KD98_9BILA|nr:hypothetical protein WR25_12466 [Diploscapter pachys]
MVFHWKTFLFVLFTVLNLAFTQPEEEPKSTALPNNTEGTKEFSTTPRYDNSNVTKPQEIEVPSIDDITNELLLTMPNQVKLSDDQFQTEKKIWETIRRHIDTPEDRLEKIRPLVLKLLKKSTKASGEEIILTDDELWAKELDDKIRDQIIEASAKGTVQAVIISKFKQLFGSYSQEVVDSWYRIHKHISNHSKVDEIITTRTTYFYDYDGNHVCALDMVGLNHKVTAVGSLEDLNYYQVVSNRKNKVNGTGEWKSGPSFPENCKMGFANFIECQGRIFAVDVTNGCGLKIFEYDRKPGSKWKEIGRMDSNRTYAGYACVRNKAFICGGITAEGKVLK